jgi:hypothetical protein
MEMTEQVLMIMRRKTVSNIVSFHPKESPLFNFYEVLEADGETRWAGDTAHDTLTWLRLAPEGSRVLVSAWDSDDMDAHIVGEPIDITDIIKQAREMGR